MEQLLLLSGFSAVFGERAAQQLFGGIMKGPRMQLLAVLTTIGMACAAKLLGSSVGLPEYTWAVTCVVGLLAGLFGTGWHDLLSKAVPGINRVNVGSMILDTLKGAVGRIP